MGEKEKTTEWKWEDGEEREWEHVKGEALLIWRLNEPSDSSDTPSDLLWSLAEWHHSGDGNKAGVGEGHRKESLDHWWISNSLQLSIDGDKVSGENGWLRRKTGGWRDEKRKARKKFWATPTGIWNTWSQVSLDAKYWTDVSPGYGFLYGWHTSTEDAIQRCDRNLVISALRWSTRDTVLSHVHCSRFGIDQPVPWPAAETKTTEPLHAHLRTLTHPWTNAIIPPLSACICERSVDVEMTGTTGRGLNCQF